MLKSLRTKLTPKQVVYFKLAVWSCLLVWMLFFLAYSVIFAWKVAYSLPLSLWGENWPSVFSAQVVHWTLPIWIVFTAMLIIYFAARFANRRLRG